MQRGNVQLAVNFRMDKNALEFRPKIQFSVSESEIERLDSQAISRKYQPPVFLRPERRRKHPSKARKAILIPLNKRAKNHFGIAMSLKSVIQRFQLYFQFAVVVNFPIKNERSVAILAKHGLFAAV